MAANTGPLSYANMAAPRGLLTETQPGDSIADQDLPPPRSPGTDFPPLAAAASPSSTESLLGRMGAGFPTTPMTDPHTGMLLSVCTAQEETPVPTDFPSMMNAFSQMLSKSLALNAAQITSSIHADLLQLGMRMDTMEQKADQAVTRINQNSSRLQEVQDQLEVAFAKIDDLENRSRRYNFRVRGLPESDKEVQVAVKSLIKKLIPDIAEHRLELDRAHRALQSPRSDGLPRDIIVKPHYYDVKEEVMRRARRSDNLTLNGHSIQIFADLSPYTVQKRRALKPLLQVLMEKEITYRWSFPIRVNFSYRNKNFGFSSLPEGERLLIQLGLIVLEPPASQIGRGTPGSTKRPSPASPLQKTWLQQTHKRSKENSFT